MATLEDRIEDLAQEIANDINATVGDMSLLDTTATDLVNAINEVLTAVGSGGAIDADSISDASTVGKALIRAANAAAARTAIGAGTSSLVIGTGGGDAKAGDYQPTWSQVSSKPAVIAAGADAAAARTAIGAVTASDISSAISALVGGAGAAYDTLVEIQGLLTSNDGALSALTTSVNNRVRHDTNAQGLDSTAKGNARTNIGAQEAAAIGNPDTDFAAVYTAARV